jgi:hypothetical protein
MYNNSEKECFPAFMRMRKSSRSNLERYCKTQIQLREKIVAEAFQLKLCTYIYINTQWSIQPRPQNGELYYLSCILSQIHYKRNKNAVAIWIKILLVCVCSSWGAFLKVPHEKERKSSSSASKNLLKLIRMCCFSFSELLYHHKWSLTKCVTR